MKTTEKNTNVIQELRLMLETVKKNNIRSLSGLKSSKYYNTLFEMLEAYLNTAMWFKDNIKMTVL